ncbi:gamma-glutamylcysteine synthetase1 [Zea mays]|uniref:Glutamate--cysteine ligase n=1 Tax=Zea mays TaxID=4577 RepID=A0A1D6LGF0_MAIZE|nr:gamma-glutamylcysteine synthetase1 [Zea mays]
MAVASRLAVARVSPDGARPAAAAAAGGRGRSGLAAVRLPSTAGWVRRRGRGGAVAASPPTEEAVQMTEPLTKEDLVAYLVSGCKPKENWRIGTEHEKFGFEVDTLRPIKYDQIRDILNGLAERFDWDKIMEENNVIGLKQGRYEIMRNYMPKVGTLGLDMMFRTCTVQVNLDFSSEQDMIRKFRAGLALQPVVINTVTLICSHIWTDTDNNRAGMLPFVFDDSFGFEQYVDYALEVPMYFVYRNKKYIDCTGMSFRDFMQGKLPQAPGELPTLNDWENHLTTIFPEVRLKRYLEMRGADGGPWRRLCALPAFWVGLLYDEESLQSILDMTFDWTKEEREMLRRKVPSTGLKTPFRDGYVRDLAEEVLKLAKNGLERRGYKEVGFLREVDEVE